MLLNRGLVWYLDETCDSNAVFYVTTSLIGWCQIFAGINYAIDTIKQSKALFTRA